MSFPVDPTKKVLQTDKDPTPSVSKSSKFDRYDHVWLLVSNSETLQTTSENIVDRSPFEDDSGASTLITNLSM